MSEEKEIHPAVALLLKRMDSNPQEFLDGEWATAEEAISAYATEEELKLVEEKLGKLWMDHTHETMLKHLFKADEPDPYSAYGKSVGGTYEKMEAEYKKLAAEQLANQAHKFQYDMERNMLGPVKGRSYASPSPVQPPAPEKPHLRQILPGPRPLQILRGFFKGRA